MGEKVSNGEQASSEEPMLDAAAETDIPPKPRPLLISFNTPQSRKDVLANAKKLFNSNWKHVSVCPDLTKTQQKEDKQLRDEVKQLNVEKPSDDKGSFLWKIVGVPGQASRRKVKIYQSNTNPLR